MLRNYLLLLINFWRYHIRIYWWRGTAPCWNVATRMTTCPTCASIFWIINELMRLMRFLGWRIVKSTITTMLGSDTSALMLRAINWLLLIMVTILASEILSHVRTTTKSLSWIRNIRWSLNGITSFTLRSRCQNWIACWASYSSRYHFRRISRWISYSSIMTRISLSRNLISYHCMLRCGLLCAISQAVIRCLINLRYASIDIFVSHICRSMLATWWTDIGRLLNLISSSKWISIRLRLLCRRSYWRHTVAFWNIFTIFSISGICNGVKMWLLLHEVRRHLLLLWNSRRCIILALVMSLQWVVTTISLCLQHLALITSWSNLTISSWNCRWLNIVRLYQSGCSHGVIWVSLDIVDIDIINPVVEISHI